MIARTPTLAAISLETTGGGVAVVARLLWNVFEREWNGQARLLTLIDGPRVQPSFSEKSRYALRLTRAQLAGPTDFVLFSHLRLAKPLLALPRQLRKPYGIFLHGIEAWRDLPQGQIDLLKDARIRIANSAYTAARVIDEHPDIGPVVTCPLALPSSWLSPSHAPETLTGLPKLGPNVVLVVGRMLASERYKGHDELIDAWPTVVAQIPDAQLIVAGTGDDLPRLQQKAAGSRASASISFTGFVDRTTLDALYDRAALFALPSRGEGFGLVYLEAMAHRRACLGSVHDAARDVIVDGQTGRLVDQDDRYALADTIASMLRDTAARERMGAAGYSRLVDCFTFDAFAVRIGSLLNGMAA